MTDERKQVETALARYASDEDGEIDWPPAARRIRESRERSGLSRSAVAALPGLQDSLYWDVETHDDSESAG